MRSLLKSALCCPFFSSQMAFGSLLNEPEMDRPLLQHEKEAGKKMLKAIRNCSSVLKILNDDVLMQSLDHGRMTRLISLMNKHNSKMTESPTYAKKLEMAALRALNLRRIHHLTLDSYPAFSSLGNLKDGTLPEYVMIPQSKIKKMVEYNGIHVVPGLKIDPEKNPPRAPTKEELDLFVKAISNHPAFPWGYLQNGCVARSNLTMAFLKAMNIQKECISQFFTIAPDLSFTSKDKLPVEWYYHNAPMVKTAENKKCIIDPGLFPEKLVGWKEWIEAMRMKPINAYTYTKFPTMSQYFCPYDRPNFFKLNSDTRFKHTEDANFNQCVVVEFQNNTLQLKKYDFERVAHYRFKYEVKLLMGPGYKLPEFVL